MSRTTSPSAHIRYPMATVCRIWGVSRATLYRHRAVANAANDTPPPARRGPQGAGSDARLLESIRAVIEASPFTGEGYLKIRAQLRVQGVRTAARRARLIMEDNAPLAPQRPTQRLEHPHDGTIATGKVDEVWGTDMTQTVTTDEGRAYVIIAVDHCSGEFIGIHDASGASRWEALEPIRQGVTKHFGGIEAATALGLVLRHDHGSNYMSQDFQSEIGFMGIASSPAFVRQPEGNGVAERAIRTLKEQLLWVRHFATISELPLALAEFAAIYNASWLRQRHGHKTPDQISAEQKDLATDAATEFKLAA